MLIDTDTLHQSLIKFIFPYSPNNWKCTSQFFIDEDTCILEKVIFNENEIIDNNTKKEEKIESKEKISKVDKVDKEVNKTFAEKNKIEKDKIEKFDNDTVISKLKTIVTIASEEKEEEKIEKLSHEILFHDLVQFFDDKTLKTTFCQSKDEHLNSSSNLEDTFTNFASTCMEEYKMLCEKFSDSKFVEGARIYSKLLLGVLHANNFGICTLSEFKKMKDVSMQDLEDLKSMLSKFDIGENELFELISEAHKKKIGTFLILFQLETKRIEGIVWGEDWETSKEKAYLQIGKDDEYVEEEEKDVKFNALFMKTVALKKDNVFSNGLKLILHCLILSEFQSKTHDYVVWKPMKTGEFPNLKEMIFFQNWFGYSPLFQFQDGIKKLPKQEMELELYEKSLTHETKHMFKSKFQKLRKSISLEQAKKFKLIKEDYPGSWKDFELKDIEIKLKKKECFSNIYLDLMTYPKPSDFLGYFLILKELYQERESLTLIESNIL